MISKIPAAIPAEKMVRNALGLRVVIGDGALKGGNRYGRRQNYLALVSAALRTSDTAPVINRLISVNMRSLPILRSGSPAGLEARNSVFSGKNLRGRTARLGFSSVSSGR